MTHAVHTTPKVLRALLRKGALKIKRVPEWYVTLETPFNVVRVVHTKAPTATQARANVLRWAQQDHKKDFEAWKERRRPYQRDRPSVYFKITRVMSDVDYERMKHHAGYR